MIFPRFKYTSMRRGQTIIEMIIALGVLVVGLLGVVTLLSNSLGYMSFVTEEYTATYLAAEGIELMKNMTDENLRQSFSWRHGLPAGDYEMDFETLVDADITCDYRIAPYSLAATNRNLLFDPLTKTYGYTRGNSTPYIRTINIAYESVYQLDSNGNPVLDGTGNPVYQVGPNGRELINDIMKVRSRVQWRGLGGGTRDVLLEGHFYNWQNSPNPGC
ncbi:MAG: hypothetical protein KGZ30_02670 [Anaplasmataceae bacterium]|nr:hypothetical protein [Anaplasmataceae bacterium]